ncbi:MAG: glycoside hydrolase family 65 protein [Bacillota bacterium]
MNSNMNLDEVNWLIRENEFDPTRMRYYESIFTLGNGYLGVRGVFEESYYHRTPGLFLAGLYDQAPNDTTELPNLPDWTSTEIELAGERFDLSRGRILDYQRVLDLRQGILRRNVKWASPQGKITSLLFERFVSLRDPHLMGLIIQIRAENYSGGIQITSSLDGQVTNSGTQHFIPLERCTFGERGIYLLQETSQSGHIIGEAASHQLSGAEITKESFSNEPRRITYQVVVELREGEVCSFEKIVSVFSTRDIEFIGSLPFDPQTFIKRKLIEHSVESGSLKICEHLREHFAAWDNFWEQADIEIKGNIYDQTAVRFAIFQLIQMTPRDDYRVSIGAKGLSGEGYKGHVFWDTEIFILPFFDYLFPEVARNLLLYRYHTLPGAIKKARENGFEGAMYAWESADNGDETCPKYGALDLKTREPVRIRCGELEHHINADVAYAIWNYYRITGDRGFLINYGAEIFCLTSRFWRSRVTYDQTGDCYEINNVIGPDENKEFINNNYFTNAMVQWQLRQAVAICRMLQQWGEFEALAEKIGLTEAELGNWLEVAAKIKLNRVEGDQRLLLQYEGFTELREVDVLHYRSLPGNIFTYLSWEEVKNAQIVKQADVIMLLYLLGEEYTREEQQANWDFYEPKTMHDSSLSAAIHSVMANILGRREQAYTYFCQAARIDLGDNMGNTDAGLHAGALGGLWQAVINGFGGVRIEKETLTIDPNLPDQWQGLSFRINYRGIPLQIDITHLQVEIRRLDQPAGPLTLIVSGEEAILTREQSCCIFKFNKQERFRF